jgi:hypothetical protein
VQIIKDGLNELVILVTTSSSAPSPALNYPIIMQLARASACWASPANMAGRMNNTRSYQAHDGAAAAQTPTTRTASAWREYPKPIYRRMAEGDVKNITEDFVGARPAAEYRHHHTREVLNVALYPVPGCRHWTPC